MLVSGHLIAIRSICETRLLMAERINEVVVTNELCVADLGFPALKISDIQQD